MKIVHNSDIEQITFMDERFYFDEESKMYYPSATTILDVYPKGYGYNQWLKDLGSNADQVMKRAGDQGTKIHNAIQSFIAGNELKWTENDKDNFTIEEWLMILKFYDFWKTYQPQVIACEESLVSDSLEFGGTLDLVCKLNIDEYKEVWYIDWKSGNAIHKSNKIQASAYQQLWNSIKEQKIVRLACMHLQATTRGADKTGKQIQGMGWKLDEVEDPDRMFKLFQHAHIIWNEENPNPIPKNMAYPDRIRLNIADQLSEFDKDAPDIKAPTSSTGGQSSGAILEKKI